MTIAESTEPKNRRWTYDEYYQMADMGFFRGQRVELIDGEIVEMAPQGNFHSVAVGLCEECLRGVFIANFWVRAQLPMRFSERYSEPEPDISVVVGKPRDYLSGHPESALLIVEISETTLAYDRGRKASLYAASGIEDYWIVNLKQRQLEVRRKPVLDPSQPFGWHYGPEMVLRADESVSPLALPAVVIRVGDLLP
jgi:Uma2 family endonuclease